MNERQAQMQFTGAVMPLHEAITKEIPKVKDSRVFDPAYFVIAVGDRGPVTVCIRCGQMNDTPNTMLDVHTDWAQQHWVVKHEG